MEEIRLVRAIDSILCNTVIVTIRSTQRERGILQTHPRVEERDATRRG